jgi:LDH2 family malate/lactate/ureidoglycolate dehydrogenase
MRPDELTGLTTRALQGLGVPAGEAADTARILVMGDLFGHHTHGVSRMESYGERLRIGGIDPRAGMRVERVAPAIVKVDGGNAVGPAVGMRALREAMACARETGAGVAFARNSNHFGACGPYCWLAAEEGFASIVASNASSTIAPTGGRQAIVGNSPIAFGVPHPGAEPLILDMALSVVARAKIREALKRGAAIPDTWATDHDGNPTTDPKAALDGFLLPIGGYKGYGLALMVDLFAGLLSGAWYLTRVTSWTDEPEKPQDLGHLFIVIDTKRLGSAQWLAGRMKDFAQIIHATPAADPDSPVRLPGEREKANLALRRREGIEVDPALRARLEAFAANA